MAYLAGGQGFEPRLTASKAAVLPLDDPPIRFEDSRFYTPLQNSTFLSPTPIPLQT